MAITTAQLFKHDYLTSQLNGCIVTPNFLLSNWEYYGSVKLYNNFKLLGTP